MSKDKEPVAYDKLGQEIKEGSVVAAPFGKSDLKICRVLKIAPKQLKVADVSVVDTSQYGATKYKTHSEVVCLDEMEATVMYLLQNQ